MSILWTKKVERSCWFSEFLILLLLGCQITDGTVNPFTVIPTLYIFKDCPACFCWVLIGMEINFLLFQHGMERLNTGIVVGVPLTAKWMQDSLADQIFFKLDAAGRSVVIEYTASFASPVSVFWILIGLFHFPAEFFVLLPPVWGYTNQSFVIGASWEFQSAAKLVHRVIG